MNDSMKTQRKPWIILALSLSGWCDITLAQAPSITSQPVSQIVLLGDAFVPH